MKREGLDSLCPTPLCKARHVSWQNAVEQTEVNCRKKRRIRQMKTLKKNWTRFAGAISLAIVGVFAVYTCVSALGQTFIGVRMALTNNNSALWLSITSGLSTSKYRSLLKAKPH